MLTVRERLRVVKKGLYQVSWNPILPQWTKRRRVEEEVLITSGNWRDNTTRCLVLPRRRRRRVI